MKGNLLHPGNLLDGIAADIKQKFESQGLKTGSEFDSSGCSPEAGESGCRGLGAFEVAGSGRWTTCQCVFRELRRSQLEKIELAYREHRLETFQPRTPEQQEIVSHMLAYPNGSLFLHGPSGSGKTTISVLALRRAIEEGRPAITFLWRRLLFELEEYVKGQRQELPIDLSILDSKKVRACIVLNDLHASRVSIFVADMLHMVLDPILNNDHQLVVTSQLGPEALYEHFSQMGEERSVAICRRMFDQKQMVEKGLS